MLAVTPATLTEGFYHFPQSFQANSWLVPGLDHYLFLPDLLKFINNQSFCNPMLHSLDTDSIVRKPEKWTKAFHWH
jgi:hypothetical protein